MLTLQCYGMSRIQNVNRGTNATYTCDGDGRRAKKVAGGAIRYYWYDPEGNPVWEYHAGVGWDVSKLFFNGRNVAANTISGLFWRHLDHLRTLEDETNNTGQLVSHYIPLPFGETMTTLPASDKYFFTGKERDAETGLDYFGARYLSGTLGRFTRPDPVAGSIFNPQSLNSYGYVWNNPLRFTDPTGMVVSWEDSEATCKKGETACRTNLQRRYEERIKQLQASRNKKDAAKGDALAATYQKLQDAQEVFHVVRTGGDGSGELTYRGEPGNLYVEMKGSGSAYGEMPDVQKLAREFKHGEQFLGGLLGFANTTASGKAIAMTSWTRRTLSSLDLWPGRSGQIRAGSCKGWGRPRIGASRR